ncbi:MAG: hypothetical protein AAB573_02585 [Patescibacteria group bacterium]
MSEKRGKDNAVLKALMAARECKVISQRTKKKFTVETVDGRRVRITTNLAPIIGDQGKVFPYKGQQIFISRPS